MSNNQKKRPNIVYVLPDEFRQDAMGFLNRDPVITPNIDRFAQEGMVLDNAVSSYPVCSPYRGQLFTGKYPYSNGVIGNCNTYTSPFGVYLRPQQECLSDVLSANGYDCGYIGKWHLEAPNPGDFPYLEPRRKDGRVWDAFTPISHRHHFNFWHSYGCNDQHFKPHYWHNDDTVEQVREVREWAPIHEANVAIDYIENKDGTVRDPNKPFILFYAPNPPHMPFDQVPQKYKDIYKDKKPSDLLVKENVLQDPMPPEICEEFHKRKEKLRESAVNDVNNYFACVSGIDEQFGRILDAIDDSGLKEDTIVIFTSDHGEMMGSHSLMHKGLWYDESFKVPFIIRYPGYIKVGREDFFLNPPDIMPTLLELCGCKDEIPQNIEGFSRAKSFLTGEKTSHNEGYYVNPQIGSRGVSTDKYMFVTVRDMHDEESYILYDRINDPCQMKNIADEHPDVVREMRERLQWWLEHTNDLWVKP